MASARGIKNASAIAVGTEAAAVTAFTTPDSQYCGYHNVHTSIQ